MIWLIEDEGEFEDDSKECCGFSREGKLGPDLFRMTGKERPGQADDGRSRKPERGSRLIFRDLNQIGGDRRGKAAKNCSGEAIGKRKAGCAYFRRHDLGQKRHHCTVVNTEQKGEP